MASYRDGLPSGSPPPIRAAISMFLISLANTRAVIGKQEVTETVMKAFLAGGHVLVEDIPGLGKTTLSADPNRKLIGDDEHGWSPRGCYEVRLFIS